MQYLRTKEIWINRLCQVAQYIIKKELNLRCLPKNTIMKNILFLLISIFFFSCQQKENKNTSVNALEPILTKKNKEESKEEENKEDNIE